MRNPFGVSTASMMVAFLEAMARGMVGMPRFPHEYQHPKPKGYGVHLSKAERKGKTIQELQALRCAKEASR